MINLFLKYYKDVDRFCHSINQFISNEIEISKPKLKVVRITLQPRTKGYYDAKGNTIYVYVNTININLFDIAHTIIHENIHLLLTQFMLNNKTPLLRRKIGDYILELSPEYKNLLVIDKLFYGTNWSNKPYYYNMDSSELLAEKIAHKYIYKIYEKLQEKDMRKNITDWDIEKQFGNYIEKNIFFINGDIYMKEIYVAENIKRHENYRTKLLMVFSSIKYRTNLFKIENYDIEKYKELYLEAMQEYIKYKELSEKGDK
jgi:hypothetical protein